MHQRIRYVPQRAKRKRILPGRQPPHLHLVLPTVLRRRIQALFKLCHIAYLDSSYRPQILRREASFALCTKPQVLILEHEPSFHGALDSPPHAAYSIRAELKIQCHHLLFLHYTLRRTRHRVNRSLPEEDSQSSAAS